jgi:hypothetical protein
VGYFKVKNYPSIFLEELREIIKQKMVRITGLRVEI